MNKVPNDIICLPTRRITIRIINYYAVNTHQLCWQLGIVSFYFLEFPIYKLFSIIIMLSNVVLYCIFFFFSIYIKNYLYQLYIEYSTDIAGRKKYNKKVFFFLLKI